MLKSVRVVFVVALIACPGLASAENAPYARLTGIEGSIFVDAGKGFVPVKPTGKPQVIGLKLGDRVMIAKGGSAILNYGQNCSIPLQAPSMTTVKQTACVVGTQGGTRTENGGGGQAGAFLGMSGPLFGSFGLIVKSATDTSSPMSP